jgi:hypothetical protein
MTEDMMRWIEDQNPDALTADGFDDAIVGMVRRCGMSPVVAYDYAKCIDILGREGMTRDEAIEYLEFNTVGAFVGENGPVFLESFDEFV